MRADINSSFRFFCHRFLILAVLVLLAGCAPYGEDISPNAPNGQTNGAESTAGLTYALAGDESVLYAVSLNAGVWKSTAGSPWIQLAASPRYAYSIAVDPNDAAHVAVGERNGDSVPFQLNRTGVWESFNAGMTWTLTFSPLGQQGCRAARSQAIPAVIFNRDSALFVATACGVGRKNPGGGLVTFDAITQAQGLISALALSETKIWARTPRGTLLVSPEDGSAWKLATSKPIRPDGAQVATLTGDGQSLAAFDNFAYMPSIGQPTSSANVNVFNQLTIYDLQRDTWNLQTRINNSAAGTGNGGRRFVKSYIFQGSGFRELALFYGSAQEIFQAAGINSDGTISSWTRIAGTSCCGVLNPNPIHGDIWDFHVLNNGGVAWIAGDGGVYEKAPGDGGPWTTRSNGLHTQHVHTVTVLRDRDRPRLAYATQDNGGWTHDSVADVDWANPVGGDVNWTLGDAGNRDRALLVRHSSAGNITDFNTTQPFIPFCGANPTRQTCSGVFYGPVQFQLIQTTGAETVDGHLDAMLMTQAPLQSSQSGSVIPITEGPLAGVTSTTSAPILIRNRSAEVNPNADTSAYKNWELVANDLPPLTKGFVVSNGHAAPVVYVYDPTELYHRTAPIGTGLIWQALSLGQDTFNGHSNTLLTGGTYGPVFVNPYKPQQFLVLRESGVTICSATGIPCAPDEVLSALISGSGKFPMVGSFGGGDPSDVVNFGGMGAAPSPSGTLAHVAFRQDKTQEMVAVSPFTGVF